MQANNIYEEKIFSKWIVVILSVVTLVFLFVVVYSFFIASVAISSLQYCFFLLLLLLFISVTINFSRLSIKIIPQTINVSYGIFKYKIHFENVEGCYLDEVSVIRYGGWGIRMGRVKGKWRLVYNIIGSPRVVISLKKGRFKEFVFSTKNPEKVIGIINQQIQRMSIAVRNNTPTP